MFVIYGSDFCCLSYCEYYVKNDSEGLLFCFIGWWLIVLQDKVESFVSIGVLVGWVLFIVVFQVVKSWVVFYIGLWFCLMEIDMFGFQDGNV